MGKAAQLSRTLITKEDRMIPPERKYVSEYKIGIERGQGPSKLDLMLALFDPMPCSNVGCDGRTVMFGFDKNITGINHIEKRAINKEEMEATNARWTYASYCKVSIYSVSKKNAEEWDIFGQLGGAYEFPTKYGPQRIIRPYVKIIFDTIHRTGEIRIDMDDHTRFPSDYDD